MHLLPASGPRGLRLLIFISLLVSLASCSLSSPSIPEAKQQLVEEESRNTEPFEAPFLFGAYTYGGVWGGMVPIYDLELALGQRLDIVHWFMSWNNDFDASLLEQASQHGRLPLIAWESTSQRVEDIAAGQYDDYIRSWAEGVREFNSPVYLRPFPEMNGDWTPWNGNPAELVVAWQRIVDIFRLYGATNVKWVWSPNITDEPRTQDNRMELYYPGEDYVDILALDGYNWGDTRSWSSWASFEQVFAAPYARIAALGAQPIWIAEVASAESGGDKAEWVREMFATTRFPRLEAVVWFNEDKETDWRIHSSDSVLMAFREQLAGTTLAGTP